MQIEYFINSCQSIIDVYLIWMSDEEKQRKEFAKYGSARGSYFIIIERFTDRLSVFLEAEEYLHYADQPPFRLLKKLYDCVEAHWEEMLHVKVEDFTEDKLLQDPKWKEIQSLSQQTKEELKRFIKERNDS